VRVISIIGFENSGKSSLIRGLLDEVRSRGECGGVVLNDAGAVSLDVPEITERHPVRTIGGG